MKKKNIFITGANGFIGRNLHEFMKDKYHIFAPSHKTLDLLDTRRVANFIKSNNIQIVIHGANIGGGRDTVGENDVVQKNLTMFFNIVRNIGNVEKIIQLGSGAEYDKFRPLEKIKEEDFDRQIPTDDYGFYKYVCAKYIQNSDKMVDLRLFGVYGKYENYRFKFISNAIIKNLFHLPIKIGQNVYFDYLYIDDLLRIIGYFIEHDFSYKAYNVSNGKRIDLLTIARIINQISDFKSEITVLNKGFNFEYSADNTRLTTELADFSFADITAGIKKLYYWYKSNLHMIDKEEIVADRFRQYINVKKS